MDCLRCPGVPAREALFAFTGSTVLIEVDRNLAVARYSLTYQSQAKEDTSHVSFAFPQDDASALFEFDATVNGRLIQCEMRDKQEARDAFRRAVQAGFSAAMAGESDSASDVFNCYLGNVRAGSTVSIRMASLIELDEAEIGQCRLTIMRKLVPRYSPGQEVGKQLHSPTMPEVLVQSAAGSSGGGSSGWLSSRLNVEVTLADQAPAESVECTSAAIEWQEPSRRFKLVLNSNEAPEDDLEILLRYPTPLDLPQLLVSRQAVSPVGGEKSVLGRSGFVLSCELLLGDQLGSDASASASSPEKEFIIVVDRSGSMSGANIRAASEALLLFLKSLPATCRFNVISFGSNFQPLFPTSQLYDQNSLDTALALQATLEADMGGTEILRPLQWLFEGGCDKQSGAPIRRSVVLITDGEVSNVQEVKDLVQSNCSSGACRVHTVGIGHGASTALIKGVARVGRGRAEFVRDNDSTQLRRVVVGLLKTDRLEPINGLELKLSLNGQPLSHRTVPENLDCLPSAQRLRVFALVDTDEAKLSDPNLRISVGLSVGARRHQLECAGLRSAAYPGASPVYQLAAARLLIKEWSDDNADGRRTEDIKQLSKATSLSSPYTTFVGVDRTVKHAAEEPKVPIIDDNPAVEQDLPNVMVFDTTDGSFSDRGQMSYMCMAAPVALACSATLRSAPIFASDGAFPPSERKGSGSRPVLTGGVASHDRPMKMKARASFKAFASDMDMDMPDCAFAPPPPPPPSGARVMQQSLPSAAGLKEQQQQQQPPTLRIARLQAFDGHWTASHELMTVLGLTKDRLQASQPDGVSEEAWITVLVLAYLYTRQSRSRAEWELFADKSVQYLGRHCPGRSVEDLLSMAKAALSG